MIYALDGIIPRLPDDDDYWVAPDAQLIGRVVLETGSSVWFGTVMRGDNEEITIGAGSNVQERCVLHTDMGYPLRVGRNCTIGHGVILHGCTIGDGALIGMGATVLNGAQIGAGSLIGAGALITEGKIIPPGVLVMGAPGRVVRSLDGPAQEKLLKTAAGYRRNLRRFRDGLRPSC